MKIIQVLVIKVDNFVFVDCGPQVRNINCEGATVVGMAWMTPLSNNGGVTSEYQRSLESAADKPTLDSIRVIMVQTNNPDHHEYYVVVADDATPQFFTDLCNSCCGATPAVPSYTMPVAIIENCQYCKDVNGNYVWRYPLPVNPNGLRLAITSSSFNGAYGTPTPPASFADGAQMIAWLQANYGAYGTWTLVSNVIILTSTTVSCIMFNLSTVDAVYCMPYPANGTTTIDALVVQTSATGPTYATVPLPGGTVTYSNTSTSPLIYVLQQLLNGTLAVNAGTPNRLQYTGRQIPVKLQYQGADVAGATFTAGLCMNTFTFPIPANPSSFNYFINGATFNGAAAMPVALVSGWATTGAMLTWLNANWSAYGVWSISGSNLILTSNTISTATLTITVHA